MALLAGFGTSGHRSLTQSLLTLADDNDRFDVREFGALGNGISDDTVAFEKALARAGRNGGTVVVPPGRFPVKKALHMRDGVTLQGFGKESVIDHSHGEPIVIVCVDAREARLHNLKILGTFAFGMVIERSTGISVANCVVSGGTVQWSPSGYCGGIFLMQSNDVTIEANELSGNGLIGGGVLSSDIQVNGFGNNVYSRGIRIVRNRCRSTQTQCCVAAYDIQHSEITENICSGAKTGPNNNNGYGILIYQRPGSPGSCVQNTVASNQISETQGSAIYLQQCNHSRIMQNSIDSSANIQDDSTLPVAGVALNQSQYVVIEKNRITRVGHAGISIASNRPGVGHVEVVQNIIAYAGGMGIHLRGLLTDIRVLGNTVTHCNGGIGGYTNDSQDLIVIADNTVSSTSGSNPGIILGNAGRSVVRSNRVTDAGGYGIALRLRDAESVVARNTVLRSGRAFGGNYPDVRISRAQEPTPVK